MSVGALPLRSESTLRRFAPYILIMIASLAGCLKTSSPSSVASASLGLVMKGSVQNVDGTPRSGVRIFIDDAADSSSITDASGAFQVTLLADEMTRLAAAASLSATTFHLFFEAGDGTKANAMSIPIGWDERGEKRLGAVQLDQGGTISGKVITLAGGRKPEAAAAVLVRLGRGRVTTDTAGNFTIADVPAGALTIAATSIRKAPATRDLTIVAGETRTLDAPLVLFPETGVQGLIVVEPVGSQEALNQAGHPFLRTFRVIGNRSAKVIRFNHDKVALINAELSPWIPVPERLDYDFPGQGGYTLYFQLADDDHQTLSEVYSLNVIVDPFDAFSGFVVEDGSPYVFRRDVVLTIDVPDSAFRMRISESIAGLEGKNWLAPLVVYPYVLDVVRDINGVPLAYGTRTIYLQFIDAFGFLSPIYHQTFGIEYFPPSTTPVFKMENGAPLTVNRLVRLDIQVPSYAREMRIYESGQGGGGRSVTSVNSGGSSATTIRTSDSETWLEVNPVAYHVFRSSGLQTLLLEFRGPDGATSPSYQQIIRVDPFPTAGLGFLINGGSPFSETRYLDITLQPPATAIAFKVTEQSDSSGGSISGNNFNININDGEWLTLVPHFSFEVHGSGVRTIYLTYVTDDGDQSYTYSQTIFVDPFPPGFGDLLINGGDSVALLPSLQLSIIAPPNANAMSISEGFLPSDFSINWQALAPSVELNVAVTGPKTIYVRFRSVDGRISPAIQRTIFYEPFPYGTAGVSINNDAASTVDPLVNLAFFGLPNLLQVRYAETEFELQTAQFGEFATTANFTLSNSPGLKKIFVQYRTVGGEQSPVYQDEIMLTP